VRAKGYGKDREPDEPGNTEHNAELQTILLGSMEEDLVVELKGRIDEHALSLEGGLGKAPRRPQGEKRLPVSI